MITYMDRVVMSAAVPFIQTEFGFSLTTMGVIVGAFRWGYSLFQIPGAWLGDKFGPRRALAGIVAWWSLFTSAIVLSWNAASMLITRFLFGVGEAGAFPIATRSLSRWMLASERGYAQGITHAGSRLGGAITPAIVVSLIALYGWRAPFLLFGLLGLIWAVVWFWYYRDTPEEHRGVNEAERELIHGSIGVRRGSKSVSVPWRNILQSRTLQYLCVMYFCYGWCLAGYIDWFPSYLRGHRGFDLKEMGFYASLPLLAGVLGDLAGGWLSDLWLKRTGNVAVARRVVAVAGFLLAAASMVPAALTADRLTSVWLSCLAVFGLELTVGVSWAVPLDIGGDAAGSVSAVMNTCGNIGGAIASTLLGFLVEGYGWNQPFLIAAGFCVVAAVLFLKIDASRRIQTESA